MTRPIVIAHRGASGERPEHTRSAYLLAIEQGCDYVEPDLVFSKDGVLIVRHENEIGATTDVAAHAEFADRRTAKVVDGVQFEGWFAEDFTLVELKTLRCRERLPALRPQNTCFDGVDEILTFEELIALTHNCAGLYVEMKHPAYFATLGFSMPETLAGVLRQHDLDSADAPVIVECFDPTAAKAMRNLITARCGQLIDASGARMLTDLRDIATYANAIGVEKALVTSDLCANAHIAGLQVHAWTYRAENTFLAPPFRSGEDPAAHGDLEGEITTAIAAGVDGVFCDFPDVARKVVDAS